MKKNQLLFFHEQDIHNIFPSTTTPKIEVEEIATVNATPPLMIDAAMLFAVSLAAVDTAIVVGIMITTLIETISRIGRLVGSFDDMS